MAGTAEGTAAGTTAGTAAEATPKARIRDGLEVFRERANPVSWKIPSFCTNDWAALRIARICEDAGVGRPFDISYGSPQCLWEGGRPAAVRRQLTRNELERYFEAYAERGVTVALTLSRLTVDRGDLADPYGNLLLDLAESFRAEAIVVDDDLARHIRRTHPGIRLVASFNKPLCDLGPTTTPEAETAYYLRLLDLYDEVVVRCEYALDDGRIGLLPRDLRDRIEVIVNQICVPGCTRGPEHMRALQDWNEGRVPGQIQGCFHNGVSHTTARLSQNVLLSNRRVEELAGMGVCKMKIGGRNAPVERFIDYLATYIFEPTGAILAIKDVLAREFGTRRRSDPTFAQYSLP